MRSDKRATKCQFGYSELLTPTESAIQELSFDNSFKTVHNAKVKLIWPHKVRGWYKVAISGKQKQKGAERIDITFVTADAEIKNPPPPAPGGSPGLSTVPSF